MKRQIMSTGDRLMELMEIWEDAEISKVDLAKRGEISPGAEKAMNHVRRQLGRIWPRLSAEDRESAQLFWEGDDALPEGCEGRPDESIVNTLNSLIVVERMGIPIKKIVKA